MTRYAVYYAPHPESALHRAGSAWLGRDALTDRAIAPPPEGGLTHARTVEITASPRRYGLHATLKPPFALARTFGEVDLMAALADFARTTAPFTAPRLMLAEIAGFLALVPSERSPQLDALAERAVRELDRFRAPASEAERAARLRAALTSRQRELLDRWGYPYVLDEWRFHITLTDRLDDDERAHARDVLERLVVPACATPLAIDAIALFVEPEAAAPLRQIARFELSAAS